MFQFTKKQLFFGASALIGALLLSHQTGLYTPFGGKRAGGAGSFGLDNDPYSDGMLITDLYHCSIDSTRLVPQVDVDPPIEVKIKPAVGSVISRISQVVVPGCPGIKFTPLPFNTAVSPVWYNLQTPLALSATYFGYNPDQSGGQYGREHIYEVQLRQYYHCLQMNSNN
jgi:hypothetical protein